MAYTCPSGKEVRKPGHCRRNLRRKGTRSWTSRNPHKGASWLPRSRGWVCGGLGGGTGGLNLHTRNLGFILALCTGLLYACNGFQCAEVLWLCMSSGPSSGVSLCFWASACNIQLARLQEPFHLTNFWGHCFSGCYRKWYSGIEHC